MQEKKQKIELDINNANENYHTLTDNATDMLNKIERYKENFNDRNEQ